MMNHRSRNFFSSGLASRRNFLRGAGVCLTLPWLESLAPRAARGQVTASGAPLRFLPIFFPNGAAEFWRPSSAGAGSDWALSPILEPFAPLKDRMITLTNLENYTPIQAGVEVRPSHSRCTGAFLTCVDSDLASDNSDAPIANGISLDQLIASSVPRSTAFDSLQVGLSTIVSDCDARNCALSQSISWKGPEEPLYKEVNPQVLFDMLVGNIGVSTEGDAAAAAAAELRRALDKSVLDAVLENAAYTRTRLGAEDQRRLDQFMNSVRELELQVTTIGSAMGANCQEAARAGFPAQYGLSNGIDGYDKGAHADVMNDLIVMAFSCDLTRVISYMLDDARSEFVYDHLTRRNFDELSSTPGEGQVGNFHGLQHAGDQNPEFATINWWLSQKVAELCLKLDEIPEGDGTVFDNTVVLYGSGMHGGNHNSDELPIVLLGGGGGRLKTDQHIEFPAPPNDRPLRDLYYTILNGVYDLGVQDFGTHIEQIPCQLIDEIIA